MVDEKEIRQAASEALAQLEIKDVTLFNVVQHTISYDFNLLKWSIQYEQSDGKVFRVVIDMAEINSRFGYVSIESVREEIMNKLQQGSREYIE